MPKYQGRPLSYFPASEKSEIDFVLDEAKKEFEFKFTGTAVWRIASTQRAWEYLPATSGEPEQRQALLNVAFVVREKDKCYWQPRRVSQARVESGWGEVRIDDEPWADGFYGKGGAGDYYYSETLEGIGLVLPIDCDKVFATGPRFGPCREKYEGRKMCEQ